MNTGIIKWYNPKKGYGFIKVDNGENIFFHISQVHNNPVKRIDTGRGVEFELTKTSKGNGSMATKITLTGMTLSTLRKKWGERDCLINIGRNSEGDIGYRIVNKEDGSLVLGEHFELALPDVECYYYA